MAIPSGGARGMGADRNRSDDTLNLKISCLNASCTIGK